MCEISLNAASLSAASIKTSQSFGEIGETGDMFADRRLI